MFRLYLAASILGAVAQPCEFEDGLCPPFECNPTTDPCDDGAVCHHGVCLTDCDGSGGCHGSTATCRIDEGAEFCADSDGLPVRLCPGGDTE